jgi:hypothetical protein
MAIALAFSWLSDITEMLVIAGAAVDVAYRHGWPRAL